MKFKKTLTTFYTTTFLFTSTITGFATNIDFTMDENHKRDIISEISIMEQPVFTSLTGKIKDIQDHKENSKYILIEDINGNEANFIVGFNTYILNNKKLSIGDTITGFYDSNMPMIMIYPPQLNPEVIVIGDVQQNFKIDTFDENLISSDQSLKLNISKETEIILKDNTEYTGKLNNKKLFILYDVSTKSIPAQTNPSKIVILENEPIYNIIYDKIFIENISNINVLVNNTKINLPAPYINEDGIIMVPVRAIAETLGLSVEWSEKSQGIMVGKELSFNIGKDNYSTIRNIPTSLGAAPELLNSKTYVPLDFFKILLEKEVTISETQISIN